MPEDITAKLREGPVFRAKRWSGDTFAEFPDGEIDSDSTEILMGQAADEIERLQGQVEWLEANSVLRNPQQHPISEYLETKDEPEPVCPGSKRGVHSEAWYDGERCSTCGAPALASAPAVCEWHKPDPEEEFYETACGSAWDAPVGMSIEEMPSMRYCSNCGRKIAAAPQRGDNDE